MKAAWLSVPVRRPPAKRQAPLPPLPPGSYDRDLTAVWNGPPPHSRDFLRGDAWGVPIPDLPFVNGGSSEHRERFLTGFTQRYGQPWIDKALTAHAERGYTHWLLWWPDARDGDGYSVRQFVDLCLYIKSWGFWVKVWLGSKAYDPRDQTLQQWQARLTPLLDALERGRAADELTPAGEYDSFNIPGATASAVHHWIGQRAHAMGASCWSHFFAHVTWWGDPQVDPNRWAWWADMAGDVDGLDYQAQSEWTIEELQARLVDTLSQFGQQGNQHKLRLLESVASDEFTRDHPTELEACQKSYLACCTKASAALWGYGNGGRLPDGTAL